MGCRYPRIWTVGCGLAAALLAPAPGASAAAIVFTLDQFQIAYTELGPLVATDSDQGTVQAEAYVELPSTSVVHPEWKAFSSALAELTGNIEVGVDVHPFSTAVPMGVGFAHAQASQQLTITNTSDHGIGSLPLDFAIDRGEILFRTPGAEPRANFGMFGWFDVQIIHDADQSGDFGANDPRLFRYRLWLTATDGGFETRVDLTTDNVEVDQILNGANDEWGVTTLAYNGTVMLPEIAQNESLRVLYLMEAHGVFQEGEKGVSVKLGDPLTLGGSGFVHLVPEPALGALLVSGAAAAALRRASRRGAGARRPR